MREINNKDREFEQKMAELEWESRTRTWNDIMKAIFVYTPSLVLGGYVALKLTVAVGDYIHKKYHDFGFAYPHISKSEYGWWSRMQYREFLSSCIRAGVKHRLKKTDSYRSKHAVRKITAERMQHCRKYIVGGQYPNAYYNIADDYFEEADNIATSENKLPIFTIKNTNGKSYIVTIKYKLSRK